MRWERVAPCISPLSGVARIVVMMIRGDHSPTSGPSGSPSIIVLSIIPLVELISTPSTTGIPTRRQCRPTTDHFLEMIRGPTSPFTADIIYDPLDVHIARGSCIPRRGRGAVGVAAPPDPRQHGGHRAQHAGERSGR